MNEKSSRAGQYGQNSILVVIYVRSLKHSQTDKFLFCFTFSSGFPIMTSLPNVYKELIFKTDSNRL